MTQEKNKYDLDLGRHKNHGYYIPWMFIIKTLIGLGLVVAAYYFARQFDQRTSERQDPQIQDNIEVEIDQ